MSDVVPSLNIPVKVIGLAIDDFWTNTLQTWAGGEVLELPNGL